MAITGNSLQLLVRLGINNGESKANLNAEIEKLQKQLKEVKIDIKIDPQAIKTLNQLSTMDFSKLTQSIKGIKTDLKSMQAEAKSTATMTKDDFKKSSEDIKEAFGHLGKHFNKSVKQGIKGDINDLKAAFKGLSDVKFNLDYKTIKNGDMKTAEKQIDAVTVSYRNLQGQIEKMKMQKLNVVDGATTRSYFAPVLDNKAIDSSMASINRMSEQARKQIEKLKIEGKLTEEQFKKLGKEIKNAGKANNGNAAADNFKNVNTEILKAVQATKNQTAAQREQEAQQRRLIDNENKRKNLIIDIERAMRTQGKNYDHAGAQNLLRSTQQLNISSTTFGQTLAANRTALRGMNAEVASTSRDSMSMIDSFKVAMEKFPIWMAASTLFFGGIRSAREMMSIIVDIDSKMVSLSKVMAEDTDFEAIFDSATLAAERFGQSISQVMDSYIEFAKQGYKGDELAGLADAGLVASNVGEITAQQASEYMTASLIQWKMDAKDAMGIIDS